MSAEAAPVWTLMQTIAAGDTEESAALLTATPSLAAERLGVGATRERATDFFFESITHYAYGGDTGLHIAAAGYQLDVARALVAAGADVQARNRRGAQPIHYAADGVPGGAHWNPPAQAETIAYLISAGADPNAVDGSKVTTFAPRRADPLRVRGARPARQRRRPVPSQRERFDAAGPGDAADRPRRIGRPAGQGRAGRDHSLAGVAESSLSAPAIAACSSVRQLIRHDQPETVRRTGQSDIKV